MNSFALMFILALSIALGIFVEMEKLGLAAFICAIIFMIVMDALISEVRNAK